MAQQTDSGLVCINVDGQAIQVAPDTTLSDLVAALGHQPQVVATALNQRFLPRSQRGIVLQSGDSVLIFQPIVGG